MEKKMMRSIGAAVRAARTKASLTQAEAAELCGVSTEVYGRVERGVTNFSIETLLRFCTSVSVSADVLLGLRRSDGAWAAEPPPAYNTSQPPEVRRLLRRIQRLPPGKVRLLCQIAEAMT